MHELAWRPALGERVPRIAETVRWLHAADAGNGGSADPLVERLLARLMATAYGGLARRPDGSWLPAAALGLITALTAGDGLEHQSIASLAAEVGLGTSAFSRGFRGSRGLTPGEHLTEARLERVA